MSHRVERRRRPPRLLTLLHAVGIFAVRGAVSIAELQRPMGLTYLAAAEVVFALEAAGLVGPSPRCPPGRRRYLGLGGVVARLRDRRSPRAGISDSRRQHRSRLDHRVRGIERSGMRRAAEYLERSRRRRSSHCDRRRRR